MTGTLGLKMKIGDKFVWKTKIGNSNDSWIWEILIDDVYNARYCLVHTTDRNLISSMWIKYEDMNVFVKVGLDGKLHETEEDTNDLFGYMLPTGQAGTPFYSEGCQHQWKEYIGFSETYYFCAVCDKKRE